VDLIVSEHYGRMVCVRSGKISSVPLANIYGKLNLVDPSTHYDADRYNGRRTILKDGVKKNAGQNRK
jgi:hypothetical protein